MWEGVESTMTHTSIHFGMNSDLLVMATRCWWIFDVIFNLHALCCWPTDYNWFPPNLQWKSWSLNCIFAVQFWAFSFALSHVVTWIRRTALSGSILFMNEISSEPDERDFVWTWFNWTLRYLKWNSAVMNDARWKMSYLFIDTWYEKNLFLSNLGPPLYWWNIQGTNTRKEGTGTIREPPKGRKRG